MSYSIVRNFQDMMEELEDYKKYEINIVDISNIVGIMLKDAIKYFENFNIKDFIGEELEKMCSVVNFYVAKKTSSVPSKIVYKDWSLFQFMYTQNYENEIGISGEFFRNVQSSNVKRLKDNEVGLFLLFGILHESYHAYQNYNFFKFLNNLGYNKKDMVSMFQSFIISRKDDFLSYKDREILYRTDLVELDANLFAIKQILILKEKGYFKNEQVIDNFIGKQIKYYLNCSFTEENNKKVNKYFKTKLYDLKNVRTLLKDEYQIKMVERLEDLYSDIVKSNVTEHYKKMLQEIDDLTKQSNISTYVNKQELY